MMRAVSLFVLAILAAGCLGQTPTSIREFESLQGNATVHGLVINDEIMPVHAATVRVVETGAVATTDEAGAFVLRDVPRGTWTLRVEEPRHVAIEEAVKIENDAPARIELVLPTIPGVSPYRSLFVFQGHYDCAHEVPTWPGDCMILYETATGTQDSLTNESFAFRLPIGPHWESVVVELDWEMAANNQLDGMRVYLENGNGTEDGHSFKVARAEGPAPPLRLVSERGVIQERADFYPETTQQAFIPDQGELAQIRVFPRGHLYEQTSQVCSEPNRCFLGVGAGLDIRFTVYATVFYVDGAPAEFSARPDA